MTQAKHHRPTAFAPVDGRIFESPDGSKAVLTIGGASGSILHKRLLEG